MIRTPLYSGLGWFLVLTACFFLFFFPIIVGRQVFYCCDNLLINVPAKVMFARALGAGYTPFWNPYIFSGMPFLADINLSLLFPTSLLFLFLPPFYALSYGILLCIFVSLMGMFGFVHAVSRSRASGAVAALLWGLSGTMITYINNLPMLQVIAVMPWVMWLLTRYLDKQIYTRFVLLICALALSVFGGHPHMIYMMGVLVVSWVWLYGDLSWQVRVKILYHIGLYTVALIAVQILPFAELVLHSTRLGRGFAYASSGSMHPASVIRLLFPAITGNDAAGTSWILGGSINGYLGIVGLFLAWAATAPRKMVTYFRWVAGLSFLVSLGSFTPFFGWAYQIIPGVSWFRSPENYLVLTTFSLCVLAGLGVSRLETLQLSRWQKMMFLTLASVMGAIALLALEWSNLSVPRIGMAPFIPGKVLQKLAGLGPAGTRVIWDSTWQNVLFVACLGAALVWLLSAKRNRGVLVGGVIGVIVLELYLFVSPVMITVPNAEVMGWFRSVSIVSRERIFTDQNSFPNPRPHVFGEGFWPEESAWQVKILRPNIHTLFGLSSPDGYASLVLRSYQHAVSPDTTDPTGVDFRHASEELIQSLGVGGVDGLICDGCLVGVTKIRPNRVDIALTAAHAVMAVSYISHYPGWRIYLDGIPQDIHLYNGFLAVQIPKGSHSVTFRFISQSVELGAMLSLITVLVLLFHLRDARINKYV